MSAASTSSLAPDPRSQCERYTDQTYAKMRDDSERTAEYYAAIQAHAPGRVCLDIGTGALAVLAVQAARAGAKHVYAVEANAAAAEAAVATVAAAGQADRVTVLHGYSTDVTLPERVDLLLHEIIGEVAGAEGVVAAIADAADRHLAPDAQRPLSIPARARSLLAPAEFPGADYFASLEFPMLAAPGARALKLPALPRSLLLVDDALPFEELDFASAAPTASQRAELPFVAARAGELRGLAVHVEIFMPAASAGDAEHAPRADVSSARDLSHWPNVFLMLPDPVDVRAGQRLLARATCELAGAQPRYTFELLLLDDDAGGVSRSVGTMSYPE